ncbi:MAG: hypothetical protein WCB99_06520 [Candidatus Cybelea sp.]
MLSESNVVEYRNPAERLDALRAEVHARGVKTVTRDSNLDVRVLRRFVSEEASSHESTIDKIEAALQRLDAER